MDKRFDQIQEFLIQLSRGNYDYKVATSPALDDIDALILGITMLGQELQVSREKHVALFEYSADAILIYDTHLNVFVDSNEMATSLLGFSKEAIRLLTIVDLFPKGEKKNIESKFAYLKKVVLTNFDAQIETKSGILRYVSFLSKKLPYGKGQFFQISLRDITESKNISNNLFKKNEELKKAQKDIGEISKFPSENPNSILRFNEKFKLLYNNAASNIHFLSDFKIEGNNLNDTVLKGHFKQAQESGKPLTVIETRNKRHYSLTLIYVKEFFYINIYSTDITDFINQVNQKEKSLIDLKDELEVKVEERTKELRTNELQLENSLLKEKQRTIELINSEKKLKISLLKEIELGDLKSSFVSTASHQFRTPLAVIQSNTELLLMLADRSENKDIEKYTKVTGRIKGEIAKMTKLMDDVLILGKLTSGTLAYVPQELDLVQFCNAMVKQFNSIQMDGRILEFQLIGEPYNVILDSNLLTHALSNLISNAFKYSAEKNNPELIISFKPTELVMSIKDYGIGIPEVEMPQLFNPFFRANNVIGIKGTGLGLSIAKEYTEINQGQIEAKSILGEGSCFDLTFKR
ncbi:PAS domain-containing sensor histidine kinase [Crocinitomicaceae bacterium]|nr:PAS domain-containing sensor histidine kinase [Crocinitomicaceae bacterium]